MTSEQRVDFLESLARSLAYPEFGEERRKREQQRKIEILLDSQKKTAQLFAKPARTL
jgi:hypothetical protein